MSERTNAGYTITDSITIGNAEFVIGENQTSMGTQYVTWECKDGDNYFWGHYMTQRRGAERDLLERAQRELEFQTRNDNQTPAKKTKERER